jgi:hypothetical protein
MRAGISKEGIFLSPEFTTCWPRIGTKWGRPLLSARIVRNHQMKFSNRQITRIHGAANPVEFDGIELRVRNAFQVFEKGGFNRSGQVRLHASGICRVKAGTFIKNFIPVEGIERKGTGIRDMIRRCRNAGLPELEIRIDGGFFVLTIRRKTPEPGAQSGAQLAPGQDQVTPQDTPQVTGQVEAQGGTKSALSGHQVGQQPESQPESMEIRVLRQLALQPMGKAQLSKAMGQKAISGQLNKVIRILVSDQTIEPSIPGKPTSRLQKYQLTEKGRIVLEQLEKERCRP